MSTSPRHPRAQASYTSRTCAADPAGQGGDATQQMQAMLEHTLQSYPPHYQAALRAVHEHPAGGHAFRCVGAMETALSEDAMTVSFDFRSEPPGRRLLVAVTMSYGKVSRLDLRTLRPGESSGIRAFEAVQG